MSQETDRVPVPTNGRRPRPKRPEAAVAADAPPAEPASTAHDRTDAPDVMASTPAFTPAQLAIGFGVVASLILLVVGRRRRGRKA